MERHRLDRLKIVSLFCSLCLTLVLGDATPRQGRQRGGRGNRVNLPVESGGLGGSPTSTNPVQVISVSKDTSPSETNTVQVRFTGETTDVVLKAFTQDGYLNVTTRTEGDSVKVATFSVDKSTRSVHFAAASSDLVNHLVLRIRNSASAGDTHRGLDLPEVSIDPPGDIVYNTGEDATFTAQATGVDEINPGRIFKYEASVLYLNTEVFALRLQREDILINETDVEHGEHRTQIVIRTGDNPMSGFIKLYVRKKVRGGLVDRIYVLNMLTLRPNDQMEALPYGYISTKDSARQVIDDFCYARREKCYFYCSVVGLNATDVRVSEMIDGAWVQIPVAADQHAMYFDFYSREYNWAVSPSSIDEAGGSKRFKCEARDGTTGNLASTEYSFTTDVDTVVDQEASNFTTDMENPDEPTVMTVTLNCAVTGPQRPVVNITLYYYDHPKERVSPDTLTRVSPGSWLATKVVTVDTQEVWRDYERYPTGLLMKARCSIFSGRYATSFIEFRELFSLSEI